MAPLSATSNNNDGSTPNKTPADAFLALVDAAASMPKEPETPQTSKVTRTQKSPNPPVAAVPPSPPASSSSDNIARFTSLLAANQSVRKDPNKKSFAEMLMDMLMDEQYSEVVTFLPDGTSWGIIQSKKFSEEVMPKVFNIRTFSSFVRKLNRWGFDRIMEKKTHEVDVFRHVLFKKGDYNTCAKIRCIGRLNKQQSTATPKVSKSVSRTASAMVTPSPKSSSSGISSNISRFPSPIYNQALHDVTSQVVGAALETLRRDEAVGVAPPPLTSSSSSSLQAMARRQVQAEMMALQNQSSVNKLRYGMGVSRLPMMYLRR